MLYVKTGQRLRVLPGRQDAHNEGGKMAARTKNIRELKAELAKLERQVGQVKKRIADAEGQAGELSTAQVRKKINAGIEFIADFDLLKAKAVNISSGGICFETASNLPFEMRFIHEGKTVSRRAKLVWLKRRETKGYIFGLQFIGRQKTPKL